MLLQDVEPPRSRTPSRRVLPSAQLFQLCSVWAPSFIDPMLCHISLMPAHVILHLSHVNHISIRDLLCYIVLSHVYLRVSSVLHVISCYFKWLGIILSHVNSCHPIYLVFFHVASLLYLPGAWWLWDLPSSASGGIFFAELKRRVKRWKHLPVQDAILDWSPLLDA